MTPLTYRLASGETWTLTPDAACLEIVGECAPDGIHVLLTRADVTNLIHALRDARWRMAKEAR